MVYEGNGFRLRPWRPEDIEDLVSVADDPAIAKYKTVRFPSPYTKRDAEWWIAYTSSDANGRHRAIEIDGRAVGGMGVESNAGERPHVAVLGYWLAPAFWGRGIMTEAVRAVARHAFTTTPIVRLEADVMHPNLASARVLQKAGFVHEATLRDRYMARDGSVYDCLLHRMLRSEIPSEWSQARTST